VGGTARGSDAARVSTRRKPRRRESSSGRRRKASGKRWLRRETTRSTGVRVRFSESRSRLNASVPAARQRGETRERSGMGRRTERSRGDCARVLQRMTETVRGLSGTSFNGGATQLALHARKPRRDRIRRGAGSETREVSGPRAHDDSVRRKGAWARGYACLNRRRDCDPGFVGQMARAPPGVRGSADDGDGPRVGACGVTKALRGRCSSVKALPNHALTARHGAEGRYPRRGSSTHAERASATRRRSNASRGVVASREACDDGIRRVCSD